jgi:hypothetical protein
MVPRRAPDSELRPRKSLTEAEDRLASGRCPRSSLPDVPHMLRHSTGTSSPTTGMTPERSNTTFMHTVRLTEMAPGRFKNFWND